ncbi:MAG TPA: hypothetical protein VGI17_04620 [Solirubrobacterales bacterium]|jgi:hypothetical protein
MRRLFFGCCAAALFFALFASSAGAVEIIESQEPGGVAESPAAGWQAGTCTQDPCSAQTPELFFKQAAGHPPDAFTQIIVKQNPTSHAPVGSAKTFLVDLPAGLSVNAQATPQCELATNEKGEEVFPVGGCPADTRVGTSAVSVLTGASLGSVPVYNLKPRDGEPARFGFAILGVIPVYLNAGVAWQSDYHEYFTIHVPQLGLALNTNRLLFDGATGQEGEGGAFLTNPSTCNNSEVEPFHRDYAQVLHADSVQEEAPEDEYDMLAPAFPPPAFLAGSQEVIAYLPKGAKPEGCENVPFEPTAQTDPGTGSADSPAPATVEVKMPFEPHADVYQSDVKTVKLSLPQGMGLNPAAAPDLSTCTEAQFGIGTRAPIECPADSRLGSVELETPVLPKGSLRGSAYRAPQASGDPESGKLYRLFLDASSAERGVSVRLLANLSANEQTGRLTATIEGAPQLPFTSFKVKLDGKSVSPLTSPSTCGPNVTNHDFEAWSGSPDKGATEPGFKLTGSPSGGPCASTGAERPFAPGFAAAPANNTAKAFTNYTLRVDRKDGEQELKGLDLTLPPGTTARLKGVAYCPEATIAAAAASTARAQIASPSCPTTSFIGTVKVAAGSGSSPLELSGNAYLGGPYKGAPLSMAIVTPALAGPFDLGTVVVRAALFVEPETGQVHVVSDPIPDVVGGAKLDLRSLAVELTRGFFVRNGTSCKASSVTGSLAGGGNDPGNAADFTSHEVSVGAWIEGCKGLGFKPRLKLTLGGATVRASHPHLRAVLNARSQKDADIAALSVALPHALFLDQASLGTVCTRVQFAAEACPKKSIYGHAEAWSPLLDKPISGPVYLRSSNHKLPDLVAHLKGQVTIDLVGRIDSHEGGIRTSFEGVPDLPVSKFELDLPGGKGGLLVASRNLCQAPVDAKVLAEGHNGRKANLSRSVNAAGCRS